METIEFGTAHIGSKLVSYHVKQYNNAIGQLNIWRVIDYIKAHN